jgi:hypothetical protein
MIKSFPNHCDGKRLVVSDRQCFLSFPERLKDYIPKISLEK